VYQLAAKPKRKLIKTYSKRELSNVVRDEEDGQSDESVATGNAGQCFDKRGQKRKRKRKLPVASELPLIHASPASSPYSEGVCDRGNVSLMSMI